MKERGPSEIILLAAVVTGIPWFEYGAGIHGRQFGEKFI
jgi:hypothetical protein